MYVIIDEFINNKRRSNMDHRLRLTDLRSDRLHKLVKKARTIITELHITRIKQGSVNLDDYSNRCLDIIEHINKLHLNTEDKRWAKNYTLAVYNYLQTYNGTENIKEEFNRQLHEHLLEDWYKHDINAADAYSGGLGFASVSGLMNALPVSGEKYDPWYRTKWPSWYNINSNLEDTDYWVFKKD
jgi:hypothetical protein